MVRRLISIGHGDHDRMTELVAPYALNALDSEERAEFEAHLNTCAECQQAVREMRDVVGFLPYALEPVAPPTHVRDAILQRVQAETQGTEQREPAVTTRDESPARRSIWSRFGLSPLGVAASAVALVIFIALGALLARQHNELEQQRAIQSLITSPVSQSVTFAQDSIHARVVMVPTRNAAYLTVTGLPKLPDNRDYQVWLMHGDKPESVGVFHPNGSGEWLIHTPRPMDQYKWVGITQEPNGGSPQPTSNPIIASNLSK